MASPDARGGPPGFKEPTLTQRLLAAAADGAVLVLFGLGVRLALGPGLWPTALETLAGAAYVVGCTVATGRTLGKRLLGLRVVDHSTGAIPVLGQALARWLVLRAGGLLLLVVPEIGTTVPGLWSFVVLIPVLTGPLHRGLHDHAAGTVVTVG